MGFTYIQAIGKIQDNNIFIKRDDLIPFSFGGNKARKAKLFFDDIDAGNYDCVVTYGSSSSNHCRVVSNMAAARKMPCYIISPEEASEETCNSKMMKMFGAQITMCPVSAVKNTIENTLTSLKSMGFQPYFIAGGGHRNIGTRAYVDCYKEILAYESENNIHFDYIFHASGTGTTQAGLICGKLMGNDDRQIIGISIARKSPYGRNVVVASVREYLQEIDAAISEDEMENSTIFIDNYVGSGYGAFSKEVEDTVQTLLIQHGIPLDCTYTGKAFSGMQNYIRENNINNKNILFIHTGGAPLFFDYLEGEN